MSKKITDTVSKPTFTAVHTSQQLLIDYLNKLIEENRPISKKERRKYHDLLSSSTLGNGTTKTFRIFIEGEIYNFGNVEFVARWIGDQTTDKICIPSDMGEIGSPQIEIKFFWKKILEHLYFVFPVALQQAIQMSQEIPGDTSFDGVLVK